MYIHSQNNQQIRNKKKFGESEKGSLKMNLQLTPLLMTKKVYLPLLYYSDFIHSFYNFFY